MSKFSSSTFLPHQITAIFWSSDMPAELIEGSVTEDMGSHGVLCSSLPSVHEMLFLRAVPEKRFLVKGSEKPCTKS